MMSKKDSGAKEETVQPLTKTNNEVPEVVMMDPDKLLNELEVVANSMSTMEVNAEPNTQVKEMELVIETHQKDEAVIRKVEKGRAKECDI